MDAPLPDGINREAAVTPADSGRSWEGIRPHRLGLLERRTGHDVSCSDGMG
jgi:hypothetical protein